ncbi:MAG: hypothetical protein GY719_25810 [bacterium]|nr:hypothetical protein [bacterium]
MTALDLLAPRNPFAGFMPGLAARLGEEGASVEAPFTGSLGDMLDLGGEPWQRSGEAWREQPLARHILPLVERWVVGKEPLWPGGTLPASHRLMILAPTQTIKTTAATAALTYALLTDPGAWTGYASYRADKATVHSTEARRMYSRCRGELRDDSKSKSRWLTDAGGGMWTGGIGAGAGERTRRAVLDDLDKNPREARQPAYQRGVDTWLSYVIYGRQEKLAAPGQEPDPLRLLWIQSRMPFENDSTGRRLKYAAALGEAWTIVVLGGLYRPEVLDYYREMSPAFEVVPDFRAAAGDPLTGTASWWLGEIERDPRDAAGVIHQRPMKGDGGRVFPLLPILGTGRHDLDDPAAAIEAMAAAGEIAAPRRWIRGHDYAAGGADAVASCGLCFLASGQEIEAVLFDPTREYPPAAGVEGVGLANARRFAVAKDGGSTGASPATPGGPYFVEQAIPKEVGVGGTFTARMQTLLAGFRVHLMSVGKGKLALAQPLAAAASATCRLCARLVVDDSEREAAGPGTVCECETPDVKPGRVAILAGPMAAEFQEELHDFDGHEGGVDDLVDSAAAAWNAGATGGGPYAGRWGRF